MRVVVDRFVEKQIKQIGSYVDTYTILPITITKLRWFI